MILAQTPLAPMWLVAPAAALLLLVIGGHLILTRRAPMPESRRRIRVANAWLMVLTVPLAAYAFGELRDTDPRRFILIWTGVAGLIGLVIAVAVVDMLNTMRLSLGARNRLRSQIKAFQQGLALPKVIIPARHTQPHHHATPDRSEPSRP